MESELRTLILSMINVLKDINQGFKPKSKLWKDVTITITRSHEVIHVSKLDFTDLIDADLFVAYNRILVQNSKKIQLYNEE